MSLLMQALKKAEQAKRSQLAGDDLIKPSEEFDDVLELVPHDQPPHNRRANDPVALDVPASELPADFSLEPIEQPPTRDATDPGQQVPSWNEPQPAADIPDALHTAVPPAASVPPAQGEPTANARRPEPPPRDDTGAAHAAAARPRSRTGPPPPSAPPPRAAPAMVMRAPNPKMMRLAALLGALFLIVATFGYLYWRAVYGAGSSKNLPPVPMPGLAGSTTTPATPADGSTIVVAPGPAPAYAPPAYEAQAYTPPAASYQPAQPAPPPAYAPPPEAAQQVAAAPATFPSNIGGPAAPTMPAMQPAAVVQAAPVQAPPSQPVPAAAAPGANAPAPTAEQMQGLSPEDYARMDRRVAEAADAAAAAANTTAGGSGIVTTSSSPAPTAATASAIQPPAPPQIMPPTAVGTAPVQVQQRTLTGEVNPALHSAYTALRQGDIAVAREQYNALLQSEPRNRDVMLGAAAVALRDRQPERAADLYGRLLDANPNDADALAGLVSIRQSDPVQTEARLRRIINLNPEAASALYALGNLYARQGRWSEAQQQYFKAHAVAPQNPDYAFNLAVGLDRINQPRLALTYYQRALALASAGGASFDRNAVSNRIRELGAR